MKKKQYCFVAYTQNHTIIIPDSQIEFDQSTYSYVPLRGHGAILAVYDIDDNCIGWIDTRRLGYADAKAWIIGTNWKSVGY